MYNSASHLYSYNYQPQSDYGSINQANIPTFGHVSRNYEQGSIDTLSSFPLYPRPSFAARSSPPIEDEYYPVDDPRDGDPEFSRLLRASLSNNHKCMWPGCTTKGAFEREADVIRHFRELHSSSKERFFCDYTWCKRAEGYKRPKPFTRKSHHKEHLTNFHYEPLSIGKGDYRKLRIVDESKISISTIWWRCSECLQKTYINHDTYTCANADCRADCEPARINMIKQKMESKHQDCDFCTGEGYGSDGLLCSACQYAGPRIEPPKKSTSSRKSGQKKSSSSSSSRKVHH